MGIRQAVVRRSQYHHRDALIFAPKIRITFQFGMSLQQPPGIFVTLRPMLSKNASLNLTCLCQFQKAPLHCDADIAARARRSITVDHL